MVFFLEKKEKEKFKDTEPKNKKINNKKQGH